MIKTIYEIWIDEKKDLAMNDKQIQIWVKDFVEFADKILTPKNKGDTIGIMGNKKHSNKIMTKYLEANKVKDGWVVTITRTEHVHSRGDVYKLVRHEGLVVEDETADGKGNEKIWAD